MNLVVALASASHRIRCHAHLVCSYALGHWPARSAASRTPPARGRPASCAGWVPAAASRRIPQGVGGGGGVAGDGVPGGRRGEDQRARLRLDPIAASHTPPFTLPVRRGPGAGPACGGPHRRSVALGYRKARDGAAFLYLLYLRHLLYLLITLTTLTIPRLYLLDLLFLLYLLDAL